MSLTHETAAPEWRLDDLFVGPDDPALTASFAAAEDEAAAFAKRWRGQTGAMDGTQLAEALVAYEQLSERTGRIAAYAGLAFAAHSTDSAITKFYGDMQTRLTAIGSTLLFFELELTALDDARLEALLAASPAAARYRPWLKKIRAFRPHQLPEDMERLLLEKDLTSASAWGRYFDELVTSLRYSVRGETLTGPQALNLLQSEDRAMRRDAAHALTETFSANARNFAFILNTLAKDKETDDRWRRYDDATSFRHLLNQVEPETVEALRQAVRSAYPRLSHRYYGLKARWLGLKQLAHYDRNAPMPLGHPPSYGWGEAKAIVLDAFAAFAPDMARIAGEFFERRWIDAAPRPGKAGGAFSHPVVPSAHPYVLMNFLGKPRDVMTLAHELGHGVHQVLAARQGLLLSQTPLTLAETASVFGEMLTFRHMLAACTDRRARFALLAGKVEDMINTAVRQIAFYEFEIRFHAARRKGELSETEIGAIWLEVQRESLGPAFALDDSYAHYWCYIPHFVRTPFYVYAYAFGDCLVNSLYALYEDAHAGFREKYFALLEAGGAKPYQDLLAPFGLDARDPGFWARGLGLLERMIGELEQEGAALKLGAA